MTTVADVLMAIANGDLDDHGATITAAIRDRTKTLAVIGTSAVKTGDTVYFSDQARPKYLIGNPVTVSKVNRESFIIDVPFTSPGVNYGRFSGAKNVRCPKTLIEVR